MSKYLALIMKALVTNILSFVLIFIISCSSNDSVNSNDKEETKETPVASLPLDKLKLPEGFEISVYAEVNNARSIDLSPSGVLYVGNRGGDKVYAVKDTDGDLVADKKYIIASGLKMPNGVAFKDGDLYVAEVNRVIKFSDIEEKLDNPPEAEVINDDYPTEQHHGWKFIAFGPDGKLYVPVGAPCNICKSKDEVYASITRLDVTTGKKEIFAEGIRNTVGFDWQPGSSDLWFTDNGRDQLGDDIPPCELNTAFKDGMHFGYPYCHGGDIADPEFGELEPCSKFTAPSFNFGAHTAPLGMRFYSGDMFPADYKGDIIVAQHGSWNRSSKVGYKLMRVSIDGNQAKSSSVFVEGWLDDQEQETWGRPVDVETMPDGSVLVSDDKAGVIYRISYKG